MKSQGKLLTPDQLIHKYPQVEILGWNASRVGVLYSANLLHGHWNRHEHKAWIIEESMIDLLNYIEQVNIKKSLFLVNSAIQHSYLSPLELVEEYPHVLDYNWGAITIGMLFHSGLLIGHRTGKKQKALIIVSSFIDLLNYANNSELKYRMRL